LHFISPIVKIYFIIKNIFYNSKQMKEIGFDLLQLWGQVENAIGSI